MHRQKEKKRKTAVLWHMQSDVLITRIGMITASPSHLRMKQINGVNTESYFAFFFSFLFSKGFSCLVVKPSASGVFLHKSL